MQSILTELVALEHNPDCTRHDLSGMTSRHLLPVSRTMALPDLLSCLTLVSWRMLTRDRWFETSTYNVDCCVTWNITHFYCFVVRDSLFQCTNAGSRLAIMFNYKLYWNIVLAYYVYFQSTLPKHLYIICEIYTFVCPGPLWVRAPLVCRRPCTKIRCNL